jgi:hypothetical protein
VTAQVQTDAVRSLCHQCRDLHQSTYRIPLGRLGLILLSVGELAKLGSNRDLVVTGFFLQELYEPSIVKALAKANMAAESSQETLPPDEGITESPKVMEIHSD